MPDQLGEASPQWCIAVEFQPGEPLLGGTGEMERCVPDLAAFRGVLAAEGVAAVQPWKWIVAAVVRGKLQLGLRMESEVIIVVVVFPTTRWRPRRWWRRASKQMLEHGVPVNDLGRLRSRGGWERLRSLVACRRVAAFPAERWRGQAPWSARCTRTPPLGEIGLCRAASPASLPPGRAVSTLLLMLFSDRVHRLDKLLHDLLRVLEISGERVDVHGSETK